MNEHSIHHILRTTLTALCLCLAMAMNAQDTTARHLYEQAENEFLIGHVSEAADLLTSNINHFEGALLQNALRLLTLCSLAQDRDAEAEHYAQQLLQENPFYTPMVQESQLFIELIDRLKANATHIITTASQMEESIDESPVPVTLITEEMIQLSTARTLQELLADYVPGFVMQEGRETNMAVRGIFDDGMNTVLFLRNGVRMNSFYSNSMPPDYRISLANIRQIEVLRGSASSLYGNVALMAVVNIITKDGGEIDGARLSLGGGSAYTAKGDLVLGKRMNRSDIMFWASILNSKGSRHDVSATSLENPTQRDGYYIQNRYNHRPSYDIGLNYRWNDFRFYFSHQYGKRSPAVTELDLLDCDNIPTINGYSYGYGRSQTIANINYVKTWNPFTLEANAYLNIEDNLAFIPVIDGYYAFTDVDNHTFMGDIKGVYKYHLNRLGEGSLLFGIQGEKTYITNLHYLFLDQGPNITGLNPSDFEVQEQNLSTFMQLKHKFSSQLILNAGWRYDSHKRYNDSEMQQFSPRAALIWTPRRDMAFTLSYAQAFEDATLEKRYISSIDNETLIPQTSRNLQLSAKLDFPKLNLHDDGNVFYSDVNMTKDSKFFTWNSNARIIGLENSLTYDTPTLKSRLTLYWQHMLSYKNECTMVDTVIPSKPINSSANFILNFQVSKQLIKNLWITGKLNYTGKQDFYCDKHTFYRPNDPDWQASDVYFYKRLPSFVLFDIRVRYTWRFMDLSLLCKNIFNHSYQLMSDDNIAYQQGRTFLATLTFNFH